MAKRQGAGAASGNVRFKALRHARGWVSQQQLADAFEEKARECGLRLAVSVRQVRRWESAEPPWPTPDYQKVLQELFGLPLSDLGFTPPWQSGGGIGHANGRVPPGRPGGDPAHPFRDDRAADGGDPYEGPHAVAYDGTYAGVYDGSHEDAYEQADGETLFEPDGVYGRAPYGDWRPGGYRDEPPGPDEGFLPARSPAADGPVVPAPFSPYEPGRSPLLDPEQGDGLGPAPSPGAAGRPSLPLPRSIAHIFDRDDAGDATPPPAEEVRGGPLNGAAALVRPRPRPSLPEGRGPRGRGAPESLAELLPRAREDESPSGLLLPPGLADEDLVTCVLSWDELGLLPDAVRGAGSAARTSGGFLVPAAGRLGRLASPMAEQYAGLTASYRQMYWVAPAPMTYRPVLQHVRLGEQMLGVPGPERARRQVAASVAETALLAGRIAFFDLGKEREAVDYYRLARRAARIADDPLLDAAVIAHSAFVPSFRYEHSDAIDRIRYAAGAAHVANAPARMRAWLSAVEAELEARRRNSRDALRLIDNADVLLRYKDGEPEPAWLDFFDSTRLHGFRGLAELAAARHQKAREALEDALGDLPPTAIKQRAVTYADLAQVSADSKDLDEACGLLSRALEALAVQWYRTAYDRVLKVREGLDAFRNAACVRRLDAELAEWRKIAEVHRRREQAEDR